MRAISLLLAGCTLSVQPEPLPPAAFDVPYVAEVSDRGGLTWSATTLPDGLALHPNGTLTGTPAEVGSFTLSLSATRGLKRSDVEVPLEIRAPEGTVVCGDRVTLELDTVRDFAFGLGIENSSYRRVAFVVPPELTRVSIATDASAFLYVADPGTEIDPDEPPPSQLIRDQPLILDHRSSPTLEHIQLASTKLTMAVGLLSPGSVTLSMTCEQGPSITETRLPPALIGSLIVRDFSLQQDWNERQSWTIDGLPDWLQLDPTRGTIYGIAEEPGNHTFTVTGEHEGQSTTAEATLGVFEQEEVACGDVVEFQTPEGYTEGLHRESYDPRGWWAGRLPNDPDLSAITLELNGIDGAGQVGFAPDGQPHNSVYAHMEGTGRVQTTFSTSSYPPIQTLAAQASHHLVVAADNRVETPASLSIRCDRAPRLATYGLPLLGTEDEVELEPYGGTPPYRWSATGLPAGVTLSERGVLQARDAEPGRADVTVTVSDAVGATSDSTHPLWTGEDGCGTAERVVCGSQFTRALSAEWRICIPDAARYGRVGVELHAGTGYAVAEWMAPGSEDWDKGSHALYARAQDVDSSYLDSGSSPPLDAWARHPLKLLIRYSARDDVGLIVHCSDRR